MIIICRADGMPIATIEDINNEDTSRFTTGWFTKEIDNLPSTIKLRVDINNTLNKTDASGLSKYYVASDIIYERENWVEEEFNG